MMINHNVVAVQRKSLSPDINIFNENENYLVNVEEASEQFRAWIFKLFGGDTASKILNPYCYTDSDGRQINLSAYNNKKGPKRLDKKLKKLNCRFYVV